MGLKDDFLEALNSVKKDLFNGSSDTDPNTEDIEIESADAKEDYSGQQDYVAHSDQQDTTAEFSVAMDDEAVFDAFKQASSISESDNYDNYYDNSDNGNLQSDVDFSAPPPPAPPPPFVSYDPDAGYTAAADVEDTLHVDTGNVSGIDNSLSAPPVISAGYSNKMYDFDRTDLYSEDKTIISKNTIIRGAIQTDDSVRLLGQVHGDIDCKSNIVVAGKVRGNTSAANAYIMDAQVDGSLQCDDVISVSSDAWVLGDVRAQQAEIDGKIKGNLDIRHAVSIGSTSSIIGNISTDELEIKRGAFINGQIMMYTPSRDVLDRFDHFEK